MWAADWNYFDKMKLLLSRHASIDARDSGGWTPLMYAAAAVDRGDTRVIESLLQAGADPLATNESGETAIVLAQRYKKSRATELLTKARTRRTP
jgi:ankyrin repeat protein